MNAVPCDGFTIPFFAIVLDGDGNFDKFLMPYRKIGVKAELFIRRRVLFFIFALDKAQSPQCNFVAEHFIQNGERLRIEGGKV